MFRYLCIAALLIVASASEIKFKDCAKHEVTHVDVVGCAGAHDPNLCLMQSGKEFKLSIDFVANQDSTTAEYKFTAEFGGVEIRVPGIEHDACKSLKCPLVKGQKYTFVSSLAVPKGLQTIKALVTASLTGQHGPLACVHMNGGVSA